MREHIRLVETYLLEVAANSYYREGVEWLHGGPATLRGATFMRRGRLGKDMGGLYFVRADDPDAWRVALAYTFRYTHGAVWQCRIALPTDQVFELPNPAHVARLRDRMADADVDALLAYANGGHLPWAKSEGWQQQVERMLTEAGFRGYVAQERGGGATGSGRHHLSLCIFDPSVIEITGRTDRKDALAVHGSSVAF